MPSHSHPHPLRALLTFPFPLFLPGYLFYKGVTLFNEDAERQDRADGYLD
jgi:hypothetical protein